MPRGTRERLRSTGLAPDGPVTRGTPLYRYLTLEYPAEAQWDGRYYRSFVHVILAAALEHDHDRAAIARCGTVGRAERLFTVLAIHRARKGWTSQDMQLLVEGLYRERFKDRSLREHLVGTHPASIQIGPAWLDGLLTRLREEYRIGRD